MQPRSPRVNLGDLGAVQAKVIVLGDQGTGKTELIRNLDSPTRDRSIDETRNDGFFTIIEIPPEELENTSSAVVLKLWEHSSGVSKQEEELAFKGALFCIITLDIRNPASANSALNKWAALRETHASDCFLFIIGTHLDQASYRRVDLKEICKSCAKKDAIYIEVSNNTLSNVQLLRKLIKQRLNYMLYRKEVISQRPFTPSSMHSFDAAEEVEDQRHTPIEDHTNADESKHTVSETHLRRPSQGAHLVHAAQAHHHSSTHTQAHSHARTLPVPALEPNILSDSVGAILASHLGTEFWPGLEEEGEELERIGWKIGSFIEQLSEAGVTESTISTVSTAVMDDAYFGQQNFQQAAPQAHHLVARVPSSPSRERSASAATASSPTEEFVDADYSVSDLRAAFEIMGLTLPTSLDATFIAKENNNAHMAATAALDTTPRNPKPAASGATAYLRKMVVKLPDGTSADMILDLDSNIEQQIELFLLSNSLANDDEARQKLIGIGRQVQTKYNTKGGRPSPLPQPYHTHKDHKDVSSPDSSVNGGSASYHLISAGNNNVPFSSSNRSASPVPSYDGNTAGNSGGYGSLNHQQGGPGKKFKLRIAVGDGVFAEVVVRSGENVQALTENLSARHQLSDDQAQRVYEQLVKALQH